MLFQNTMCDAIGNSRHSQHEISMKHHHFVEPEEADPLRMYYNNNNNTWVEDEDATDDDSFAADQPSSRDELFTIEVFNDERKKEFISTLSFHGSWTFSRGTDEMDVASCHSTKSDHAPLRPLRRVSVMSCDMDVIPQAPSRKMSLSDMILIGGQQQRPQQQQQSRCTSSATPCSMPRRQPTLANVAVVEGTDVGPPLQPSRKASLLAILQLATDVLPAQPSRRVSQADLVQ
jgi:hypothetical protein